MMEVIKLKMLECDEPQRKRRKLEENVDEPKTVYKKSLLDLSDDVLLLILSLVHPPDLLSLSMCCRRLYNICCDKSLWEIVDIRPHILESSSLEKFVRCLQSNTKFLATRGPLDSAVEDSSDTPTILSCFLLSVAKNAPNLKTLILENHVIDSSKLLLEDFPSSLEQLEIHNCNLKNIPNAKSYFYKLEKILPKLKKLVLLNNVWFNPHSLLAISKSPTLEHLVLTGCDVSDCLPYASLAANFGFSALKVLDLRKTLVSDIEVTCFNRTVTLLHLYLGAINPEDAHSPVTDYSITTFGGGPRDGHDPRSMDGGIVIIEVNSVSRPVCKLETLVVANYSGITDITLRHAAYSMRHLKHLDVTGTGCSTAGLLDFKRIRPEVKIIPESMG